MARRPKGSESFGVENEVWCHYVSVVAYSASVFFLIFNSECHQSVSFISIVVCFPVSMILGASSSFIIAGLFVSSVSHVIIFSPLAQPSSWPGYACPRQGTARQYRNAVLVTLILGAKAEQEEVEQPAGNLSVDKCYSS